MQNAQHSLRWYTSITITNMDIFKGIIVIYTN